MAANPLIEIVPAYATDLPFCTHLPSTIFCSEDKKTCKEVAESAEGTKCKKEQV
jgi:hypothetical protein